MERNSEQTMSWVSLALTALVLVGGFVGLLTGKLTWDQAQALFGFALGGSALTTYGYTQSRAKKKVAEIAAGAAVSAATLANPTKPSSSD